jgi:WD40 repeat protein
MFWTNAKAPYLVGVDFAGNVWQSGTNPAGQVLIVELTPQGNNIKFSITDTDGQPSAFAFDHGRSFYVLNAVVNKGTGASIDVYPAKNRRPRALHERNAKMGVDLVLDSHQNVYMSWIDGNNIGHIDEFVDGRNPAVTLPMSLGFVGGVAFDNNGKLLVVDQGASVVDVFNNPQRDKKPSSTIALKSPSLQCTFNKPFEQLFCTDYTVGSVDVYDYTAGKASYDYSWTNGLDPKEMLQGIAIFPRAAN